MASFTFRKFKNAQFGDIENTFSTFEKEFDSHYLNQQLKPYNVENESNVLKKKELAERLKILNSQKEINLNELEIQKNDLERNKKLHEKGVISDQEFENQKLIFLQTQRNYKNLLTTISQLKSSINELDKQNKTNVINSKKENVNLSRNLIQSFNQLKKSIRDWELNYVMYSEINGRVNFLNIWSENQPINVGEHVFTVTPFDKKNFIGKIKASALNSGKIEKGQNFIKLSRERIWYSKRCCFKYFTCTLQRRKFNYRCFIN